MSALREWRLLADEKAEWPRGSWTDEPDKLQWIDEGTGLDCLIVRNGSGALCGYVGVGPGHPLHGVGYSQCMRTPPCDDSWCGHSPGSLVDVHGGLTFADSCTEPTRELWNRMRTAVHAQQADARRYPQGDAATRAKRMAPFMADDAYDAWREQAQGTLICHVPEPGRPANVWWFGFDCAHYRDVTPAYACEGQYRDIDYVTREVASLARQLAEYGAMNAQEAS